MKAVILAGGFGTRLREVVKDVPKPMAPITGKPFLEHQINFLRDQGLEDIILSVHYKSAIIKSHFGEGIRHGVNITYSEEDTPLGTAGAIKLAQKYIDEPFFVLNGDSYADVNLSEFLAFHKSNKGLCSMILTETEDNSQYGNVVMQDDKITSFSEKTPSQNLLVNAGVYLFEPGIFELIPSERKVSLEREIFPELARRGELRGHIHNGYFMDIGRPETYAKFKQDFLKKLSSSQDINVREAMKIVSDNRTDLLLITDKEKKLLGIVNDNILKKYLVEGGEVIDSISKAMVRNPEKVGQIDDDETRIYELLQSGTRHVPILDNEGKIRDIKFREDEIKIENFPTLRGKSPLRISFAGGGTDLPYFFEKYGGAVINTTINQYCYATVKKRADSKIIIESNDADEEVVLDGKNLKYNGEHEIIKSVFNIINPGFGMDFYLHNDVPPGRGLGSSASFAGLITKLIGGLQGIEYDDETIAETAYKAEVEELKIPGGKQDQYAAVFGGFNWIEFGQGDKKIMHPLRIKENTLDELRGHLTLCYTGNEHSSRQQHKKQEKTFQENEIEIAARLQNLKGVATEIKESLLSVRPNFERIGELLHTSWENKRRLSPNISNKRTDNLYEVGIKNGAYGGKLLGSGGGGYILFIHPPKKRNQLVRALEGEEGQLLNFDFETRGTRTWVIDR